MNVSVEQRLDAAASEESQADAGKTNANGTPKEDRMNVIYRMKS
jgi:hypothetical protein